jgi:hypothetical protein
MEKFIKSCEVNYELEVKGASCLKVVFIMYVFNKASVIGRHLYII